MNVRSCELPTIVLIIAGTAFSNSLAMADQEVQYAGSSYGEIDVNPYYSNYSLISLQPGYNPGTNQRPTGTASGDAGFSNSDTQGTSGSTGVWAESQSSGFAGLIPAGSSASSSDSNLSQISLYYSKPGLVAFDVTYSLQNSVLADSPNEYGVDYADIKVYVDGTKVYSTSSVASSFGTGVSQTTGSSGTTALMAFDMPAGLNTIEVVTYTNGYGYSVAGSSPPSVPEPPSIVMMGFWGIALVGLLIRRYRKRKNGDSARYLSGHVLADARPKLGCSHGLAS